MALPWHGAYIGIDSGVTVHLRHTIRTEVTLSWCHMKWQLSEGSGRTIGLIAVNVGGQHVRRRSSASAVDI